MCRIKLCNRVLDFLMNRPQGEKVVNTSTLLMLNTGAPQGCVLSALLYPLFTHTHTTAWPRTPPTQTIKFADDTTVVGQITNNETAYRVEVRALGEWC